MCSPGLSQSRPHHCPLKFNNSSQPHHSPTIIHDKHEESIYFCLSHIYFYISKSKVVLYVSINVKKCAPQVTIKINQISVIYNERNKMINGDLVIMICHWRVHGRWPGLVTTENTFSCIPSILLSCVACIKALIAVQNFITMIEINKQVFCNHCIYWSSIVYMRKQLSPKICFIQHVNWTVLHTWTFSDVQKRYAFHFGHFPVLDRHFAMHRDRFHSK